MGVVMQSRLRAPGRWMVAFVVMAASLAAASGRAQAAAALPTSCKMDNSTLNLVCEFRTPGASVTSAATAAAGGKPLPAAFMPYVASPGAGTAVYFLIDVSDQSKREKTIEQNRKLVLKLISRAATHDHLGLAVFTDSLVELAPIGSDRAKLEAAAKGIKGGGSTTELYRSGLDAVARLSAYNAVRKVLVLISDGLAQDKAYKPDELLEAAKKAGVRIVSLGYAEHEQDLADLQELRRFAEKTDGLFYAVIVKGDDHRKRELPEDFVPNFFPYIDNGASISVSLKGLPSPQTVAITVTTVTGEKLEHQELVRFSPPPDLVNPGLTTPAPKPLNQWWVIGIGTAAALALVVLVAVMVRRKAPLSSRAPLKPEPLTRSLLEPVAMDTAYGWLVMLDGNGSRHPLRKTAVRIGRNANNDLCLANDSVSGHHAEIHRLRDGRFAVTDLGSANGTYVNDEKVERKVLEQGDMIEFGEVRLRLEIQT